MKKKILIIWGNTYAFLNLDRLIKKLSKNYNIDVLILTENNTEIIEDYCLNNKNIKKFNILKFSNQLPFKIIKNYFDIKEFCNSSPYNFCIAGDECQLYSKYTLSLLTKTKKIIYWTHTSFLLQNNQVIKSYEGGNFDDFEKLYNSEKNLYSEIKFKKRRVFFDNIYTRTSSDTLKRYIIRFLKNFIIKILKKINGFLLKLEQKFILTFLSSKKIKQNLIDQLSQVGSGNEDTYLFNDQIDVDIFNGITGKKCAFLTSHPLSYAENTNLDKNTKLNDCLYFPISIYPYSLTDDRFLSIISNSILKLKDSLNFEKIIVRKHPLQKLDELDNFKSELQKRINLQVLLEIGDNPIQNEAKKYKYCFSTLSAAIKDIRANCDTIKIFLNEEISKDIAPKPKLFYNEDQGIYWIDKNYDFDQEVLVKQKFFNYKSIDIEEYLV
ncbi:MAG: hypothetical protein MRY23_06255 [Pelagibacteraceae bacterium]|nr:hypothetical protein [Pelagibacteraceae bacterium]MCI5078820.1 hypothetical protein [Pelagibacteraceae bacterium]